MDTCKYGKFNAKCSDLDNESATCMKCNETCFFFITIPQGMGIELDPTGKSASEAGAKLDQGKIMAAILGQFSRALTAVAEVCTHGATKYSRGGWQTVPNGIERYDDAKWRHALKGYYEDLDIDSGLMHDAHEAWNILAKLELKLRKRDGIT